MRFRALFAAVPVALIVLAAAPAAPAAAWSCDPTDPLCQQVNDAQGQSNDIQAQIDAVTKNIANAQSAINQINALLQRLQTQRAQQEAQIAATQQRVDDLARQIRLKQAEIDRSEAQIAIREQYLDMRVRSMDKHGTVDYLQLVVTAKSFDQLIDRVMLMQAVIRGDQQLLDNLKTERQQLGTLKDDLAKQKTQQDALLAQQRQQKAALDVTIGQQAQALAIQQQLESQLQAKQAELEAAKKQADAQVSALQQQYDQMARGIGGGTGDFGWPLGGSRYITQPFGCTDLWGEPYSATCPSHHTHTGIDIAGNGTGTPVYAADAGIITYYPGSTGYGNYAIIVHGNGYSTLYGHMSAYSASLQSGSQVLRGTVIGYEGSTGFSTGPHLHFEIRYNGVPQNPCLWEGC